MQVMRGHSGWSYTPYLPFEERDDSPRICRIAPSENSIEVEWLDGKKAAPHMLFYRKRGAGTYSNISISSRVFLLEGLERDTEYELYVEDSSGHKSNIRLAKTGFVPGKVVSYLHPDDRQYIFSGNFLCSPSIVRLPTGRIIASNDLYGDDTPQNLTILYSSDDDGETWCYLTELFPCNWGKLFYHQNKLYMLAQSREYGDLLIGCSEDEGKTWGTPTPIFRSSCLFKARGIHKTPMPILRKNGRLWTAIEYGGWEHDFSNALLSIDENDDPMIAENWCCSRFLKHDVNWDGAEDIKGAIEGNVLEAPDGKSLINFLRYNTKSGKCKALLLKGNPENPEESLSFYKFVEFPMGHSKSEIYKKEGVYYAIGNRLPLRNILSIYKSSDLENWDFVHDIVNCSEYDDKTTAFQYPACLLEGDSLTVLARTAFNGAMTYHNNNYITVHKTNIK